MEWVLLKVVLLVVGLLVAYKLYWKVVVDSPLISWMLETELWIIDHLPNPWRILGYSVHIKLMYMAVRPLYRLTQLLQLPFRLQLWLIQLTSRGQYGTFMAHYNIKPYPPSAEVQQHVVRLLATQAFAIKRLEQQRIEVFNAMCQFQTEDQLEANAIELAHIDIDIKYQLKWFKERHRTAKKYPWIATLPTWQDYTRPDVWPNILLNNSE